VRAVADLFGTLNLRELPVALQLPDWNQWLPAVHPKDAFDARQPAITGDETGRDVGTPFYELLYRAATRDPSPRNLGDIVKRLETWMGRGATCYTQTVTSGPGWRASNGEVAQALAIGGSIPAGIDAAECERIRFDRGRTLPLELAKRSLIAWATVKTWELVHGGDLETRAAGLTEPVCAGPTCVDASEPRGTDKFGIGMNGFNRAPHYVAYDAREFQFQHETIGRYDTTTWYHLQLILNPGYRRTAPSHFARTAASSATAPAAGKATPTRCRSPTTSSRAATSNVLPKLRELGVSETVIGRLLDWCVSMWDFGPWDQLRTP
jgi:hypothetical protein